jgi:hypothetical protein
MRNMFGGFEVALNQVLVSFGDTETTNRVIAAIQADGTCWCGGTIWQGGRRCASASRHGRQPRRMSSAAWRRCRESPRDTALADLREGIGTVLTSWCRRKYLPIL